MVKFRIRQDNPKETAKVHLNNSTVIADKVNWIEVDSIEEGSLNPNFFEFDNEKLKEPTIVEEVKPKKKGKKK
jgi:hypothetical protein